MKYSNYIGIVAALCLIAICFQPWVYIPAIDATLTGLNTEGTNLGKPGILNIVFSVVSISLFLIAAVWSKRANLFVSAFNLAWALRNYLLITQCQMGECPEKKWAIYAMLILSVIMLLMAMFPKMSVQRKTV